MTKEQLDLIVYHAEENADKVGLDGQEYYDLQAAIDRLTEEFLQREENSD